MPPIRLTAYDFRGMCPAGLRATEDARSAGRTVARCPRTGAELRCGGWGIWYVVARADSGSTLLPADAAEPPAEHPPMRAPGALQAEAR